jgi:Signal transduction histidine kinase
MSRNRAINTKLVQLILIPCSFALLGLAILFYLLQSQFLQERKEQHDNFLDTLLINFATQQHHATSLEAFSDTILSMEGSLSFALLNNELEPVWERGIPLKPYQIDYLEQHVSNEIGRQNRCIERKCYLIIPPPEASLDALTAPIANASFFLVVTDNLGHSLARYQFLLALVLGLAICMVLAGILLNQFKYKIILPLENIHSGIREYINGRYGKNIVVEQEDIYGDLVEDINELATLQKTSQEDLQKNIDQSTSELRETLETVEIQNIELDIARKTALESSRVKSEFLANTSHEIRTPLNGIIGFSELLKKTVMNSQQAEYLETIDESAKGLLTIINDILDFSRLEIGKLTLEYKPVRLRQVIEESLRLQAPSAHEKKLRLLTIIDHDIPEHLLGDPLRLKQVLTNLLSNAIKFTNTGHILISVGKEDRADNQISLQFRITDSGIGLNQAQQDKLFDAFTQLDSSESRAHGGTGLGLAIAKGLVDRMHGQIGVDSEPGKGATFWFSSTLGRNPNAANTSGYLTGTLRNVRAMVYDCSSMSRTEITHYMRGWGAEINEISRFEDIDEKTAYACRSGQIHLAIVDAQVNDKTFDKLKLRKIIDVLNLDYSIPVIVLASPSIQRLIEPAITGTHSVILQRPILCNRLHQTVCEQLGIIIPDTEQEIAPPQGVVTEPHKQTRILAVDDNPANLRLVSELLKDIDVDVTSVDNGADAVKLCDSTSFDLILMDIQMPGMDGIEATKELRKRENPDHRTPVVALTAHAANEQKSKLLLAGMDDYLTKPVSENELRHIIDRWVSRNPYKRTETPISRASTPSPDAELIDNEPDESEKLINIQLSLELAKNKPDLARDMLNMLLDSLPVTRTNIETYLSEGNHKELQEAIHKLHGGCCYCGVPRLKKYSAELDAKMQSALEKDEVTPLLEEKVAHLLSVINQQLEWQASVEVEALFSDED